MRRVDDRAHSSAASFRVLCPFWTTLIKLGMPLIHRISDYRLTVILSIVVSRNRSGLPQGRFRRGILPMGVLSQLAEHKMRLVPHCHRGPHRVTFLVAVAAQVP